MNSNIIIHLDGGLVQAVYLIDDYGQAIPVPVTIHDYDVDDVDEERYTIQTDAHGRDYIEYEVSE